MPAEKLVNYLYPCRCARYSSNAKWQRMSNGEKIKIVDPLPTFFRVLTWNIDFASPSPQKRMHSTLAYIQKDVFRCRGGQAPEPCCILLQEVHVRAFPVIQENEWIRRHFAITPVDPKKWPNESYYGNVTLVSRSIPVSCAYSLEYSNSDMNRNALVVDLKVGLPDSESPPVTVRVVNTHLESLAEGAKARPVQMTLVGRLLKESGLQGGVVGGDMNAIGSSDYPLVDNSGLLDTWKGGDKNEDGHTWGYQPKTIYPPGRLDKILIEPNSRFTIDEPRRIGIGMKTGDDSWMSDHYGLLTTVNMLAL